MGHGWLANFFTFFNKDNAKRQLLIDTAIDHLTVSWFKDMEWQHHPRKEDKTKREERHFHSRNPLFSIMAMVTAY